MDPYTPLVNEVGPGSSPFTPLGTSSTFHALCNTVVSVVGAGLLQLPRGVAASGWAGIGVLLFLAGVAFYTGIRLIQCLRVDPKRTRTYADLGEVAFGPRGRVVVDILAHVMLCGAATVYLVLSGENVNALFPSISTRLGVVMATGVVWFHVFLKTLREVGALSAFNALVAVLIFVVVVYQSLTHRPSGEVVTKPVVWGVSLGTSFAAFSFSYCVHPILPSVYESMRSPHQFNTMLGLTFLCVLCIYVPISAVGYAVYGEGVKNVIYNNLPKGPPVTVVIVAVTVHVLCSYAIVISPSEQALERKFRVEERSNPLLWRVGVRTCVVVISGAIATAMANVFGPFLDLVASISASCTVFIFPCLMYLSMFRHRINALDIAWNLFVVFLATVGAGFGIYSAVKEISATFNKTE